MLRKYNINGAMYEYDFDRPTVRDAMMLKTATKMNMAPFAAAFHDADPDVFVACGWLLLTKAGVKGPTGEPIQLAEWHNTGFDVAGAIDRYGLAIAATFHVMPWDLERLTVEQFEAACREIDRMNKRGESCRRE